MKNLWPDFNTIEISSIEDILDEQSKLLPSLTGDLVYARIQAMDPFEALANHNGSDFAFNFIITGKFLKNYSFKVFGFSHDISIYPAKLRLDSGIAKELGLDSTLQIQDAAKFEKLFEKVVKSNRLQTTVAGIIKLTGMKAMPNQPED